MHNDNNRLLGLVIADAIGRLGDEPLRCPYCLQPLNGRETLDHILATKNGGTDDLRNLVACCHECNYGKSDHYLARWLQRRRRPFQRTIDYLEKLGKWHGMGHLREQGAKS